MTPAKTYGRKDTADMNGLPKIIAIVGTNASGKSGLGVRLAKKYGGEVVSADSRQVFAGLDLGSGKITPEETMGVPHHLIDVCAPGDFFSMADYQRLAYRAIDDILSRGRLPFLVGGTGLYLESVIEGYVLSDAAPDLAYRAHLETHTTPELYAMLKQIAPDTNVDPQNRNRVMRSLERIQAGDSGAEQKRPRYDVLRLGVTWDRKTLCQRIDERLERRLDQGMISEVQRLMDAGVSDVFLRKLGLEYRYICEYLLGEISSREEMIDELSRAIKRFAKRQMTWFRRDPGILWLDMAADPFDQACRLIDQALAAGELPSSAERTV